MEWYCLVFNSDKVSSAAGAQYLYEAICEGDFSLVGDISIIDEFYDDLLSKANGLQVNKGKGFVIIGCDMVMAEKTHDLVQSLAKTHGLSYYEPQNMTYSF